MTSYLNALVAREHTADLRRAATLDRGRSLARSKVSEARTGPKAIVLRPAGADDAPAVARLAELDEEPALSGQTVIAQIDGDPVAAMSLEDGRVVSNPFVATRDAVTLLKLHVHHLGGGRRARQPRRRWRPRFA